MGLTNFPNGITSFGVPVLGSGDVPVTPGNYWFVNGSAPGNGNGSSPSQAFTTLAQAISALQNTAKPGGILVSPGTYNETLTIPGGSGAPIFIYGMGNRGDVKIQGAAANANALTNNLDDVSLYNLRINATGTGEGCVSTGRRFNAYGAKFENTDGTGVGLELKCGTSAQQAAGTAGDSSDSGLWGCEIAWAAKGLLFTGSTDGLSVTEVRVDRCLFHDGTDLVTETAAGAGNIFRNLWFTDCTFSRNEDGTEPAAYMLLNTNNGNKGMATRCSFPTALAGGKNLVSTGFIWAANFMTDGISTGQPS